jgi:hypothetical protein
VLGGDDTYWYAYDYDDVCIALEPPLPNRVDG